MASDFFLNKLAVASTFTSLLGAIFEVAVTTVKLAQILEKETTLDDDDDTRGSGRSTFAFSVVSSSHLNSSSVIYSDLIN